MYIHVHVVCTCLNILINLIIRFYMYVYMYMYMHALCGSTCPSLRDYTYPKVMKCSFTIFCSFTAHIAALTAISMLCH